MASKAEVARWLARLYATVPAMDGGILDNKDLRTLILDRYGAAILQSS